MCIYIYMYIIVFVLSFLFDSRVDQIHRVWGDRTLQKHGPLRYHRAICVRYVFVHVVRQSQLQPIFDHMLQILAQLLVSIT